MAQAPDLGQLEQSGWPLTGRLPITREYDDYSFRVLGGVPWP
jgi:hypothetical protein